MMINLNEVADEIIRQYGLNADDCISAAYEYADGDEEITEPLSDVIFDKLKALGVTQF